MNFSFKEFIVENAEVDEVVKSLPKSYQLLVKPFKISFEAGNTLKNDKENVGYMDVKTKKIVIASPWNYSKKFTLLHEIGHLVYMFKMTPELKKEWAKIVKKTKDKQDQNVEELFCMSFACFYSGDHCVKIHDHPEWHNFIKNRVPK